MDRSISTRANSTDREWADWLFVCLHGSRVLTDADPETWFESSMNLPPIDFHITQLEFGRGALEQNQGMSLEHLTPLILRHLGDLPQLGRFVLHFPKDGLLSAIATLKRLKGLSLRNANQLTDEALKTVGSMTNLEMLGIESNQITDAGLKNLSNLTSLTALDLSDARNFHGSGLRNLRASTKLQTLGLSNSGIDDAGLAEVARLGNLQFLDLDRTWISPKGLAALAGLPKLKQLSLDGCRRINDGAFSELAKFKHLRSLNLDNTRVTGQHAAQLANWVPNCSITWPAQVQQARRDAKDGTAATQPPKDP